MTSDYDNDVEDLRACAQCGELVFPSEMDGKLCFECAGDDDGEAEPYDGEAGIP